MNRFNNPRVSASATQPRPGRHDMLLACLLFAAPLLVYAQVWGFGFINFDDPVFVKTKAVVEGITFQNVKWSLTAIDDGNLIPLTWISLMLDTNLYGYRPAGYHLTNVLLHATNTMLLFFALAAATRDRAKSVVVAALFALHPLHVESVAWIAERKDVLSTLFGLLSLLAYFRYANRGGAWLLAASFFFFVCSLFSKQTLVTLPFVFLLLDYWPLGRLSLREIASPAPARRSSRGRGARQSTTALVDAPPLNPRRRLLRVVAEKLPFLLVSAAFSAVAIVTQSTAAGVVTQSKGGGLAMIEQFSLKARLTNAIYAYAAYLAKTIFPQNLAIYYPHPHESLSWIVVSLAAALLLAISAAAVGWVRRFPFLFVGWFWYLGTLVPTIGLVQVGSQQMADRYTYFPLIGIFLAVTWLVPELVPLGFLRKRVLPVAVLVSIVMLTATTFSQISYWHDSVTLFRHSMECTADNPAAHEFLGDAYLKEGSVKEAAEELQKSIDLDPLYPPTRLELGRALQQLGRSDEAIVQYQQVLALNPQSTEAHTNWGFIHFNRRQYEDAKQHYRKALEIDPNYLPAHVDLAALLMAAGDYSGAINESEQALRLQPNLPASEICIGMALREQGHLDEAIGRLRHIAELAPDDEFAKQELARTLAMKAHASTK
jgi:protein O-mannosyl-transferase